MSTNEKSGLQRDTLFDEYRVRGVVLDARVEEDDVTVLDEDVTQPQPDEERI